MIYDKPKRAGEYVRSMTKYELDAYRVFNISQNIQSKVSRSLISNQRASKGIEYHSLLGMTIQPIYEIWRERTQYSPQLKPHQDNLVPVKLTSMCPYTKYSVNLKMRKPKDLEKID